jgi:hypothetical protein
MSEGTGSRTSLRLPSGRRYLLGGTSVAIVFSAEPGEDSRWGLRLFLLSLVPALVLTVLLITRLRLDYLRSLLPWYGIPYLVWLIGAPPRGQGPGAVIAYAWGLLGTIAFFLAGFSTTRP